MTRSWSHSQDVAEMGLEELLSQSLRVLVNVPHIEKIEKIVLLTIPMEI